MNKLPDMFSRQADLQRSRSQLTWSEKARLALLLRDAALGLRRTPQRTGVHGLAVREEGLGWMQSPVNHVIRHKPKDPNP